MKIIDIRLNKLVEAPWNPNQMDQAMLERLKTSLKHYGLVTPLVVRPFNDHYEVLSGNQRLKVIGQLGFSTVPCVAVNLNDQEARLLAQTLNRLHGEDELSLKGVLLEDILSAISENDVLSLLPETAQSLQALSSMGKEDLAQHLQAWQEAQAARLNHVQLQFTRPQLDIVQEALSRIMPHARADSFNNPNLRSNAFFLICKFYIERRQNE
jgi:ParB family transcriptional regulator, chromosome partitioning protein